MSEEEIYEIISDELESEKIKKGVWTKAFSKADGDENKTKAIYIKLRYEQIVSDQETKNKLDIEKTKINNSKTNTNIESKTNTDIESKTNTDIESKTNTDIESKTNTDELKKDYNTELSEFYTDKLSSKKMEEYGINYDGEKYIYKEYKYDKIEDAIKYIELKNNNPNSYIENNINKNRRTYNKNQKNQEIFEDDNKNSSYFKYLKIFFVIDLLLFLTLILSFSGNIKNHYIIMHIHTATYMSLLSTIYFVFRGLNEKMIVKIMLTCICIFLMIVPLAHYTAITKPYIKNFVQSNIDSYLKKNL